jgi:hypothetical protein
VEINAQEQIKCFAAFQAVAECLVCLLHSPGIVKALHCEEICGAAAEVGFLGAV